MLWQVYEAIQEGLADGGRAYIICPLVGESTAKGFADTKVANLRCLSIHPLPISRQRFSCQLLQHQGVRPANCNEPQWHSLVPRQQRRSTGG